MSEGTFCKQVSERIAEFRYFWRSLTGEAAYDRYLERHRREHPDHEPMTEREFWLDRIEWSKNNVQARCC